MIDELIFTILNRGKADRRRARADGIATYGEVEGQRRWKAAKKKAKQILAEGGCSDDYYDYQRTESMTGLRTTLLAAIASVGDAHRHADELCGGTATHAMYEDTTYGSDLVQYLKAAETALRAARNLHSGILQGERMNAADEELERCPQSDEPCRHGQPWPCQVTRASWALFGLDALEQVRTAKGGAS